MNEIIIADTKILSYTKIAMKNTRQTNINIHRDAWVEVNISNLENNIREIKKNVPQGIKLLGVVKADAYGHGAVMLAPTILASGIDMLGVASIDEGVDLRQAGINCDILVLGAVPVWAVESAVKNDITISIFSEGHIQACEQVYKRTGIKPKVHIKLDTGMNRIGVRADEAINFIKKVQSCDFLELQGIFTHLAAAEELDKAKEQIEKWNSVIISIGDFEFRVQYNNEDMTFSSYEKHLIFRYKYLNYSIDSFNKEEKEVINRYLIYNKNNNSKVDEYCEVMYEMPFETIKAGSKKSNIQYVKDDDILMIENSKTEEKNEIKNQILKTSY